MSFDINKDPVTDNECDDCTDDVSSSAVEYGDNDIGDLSLVVGNNPDLEIVVLSEISGVGEVEVNTHESLDTDNDMEVEDENYVDCYR